ncbi:phage/plasmid primase, P4 family [Alkalicoccobacillus plakortidis]|uniref:Phage/plasmid primase, P4 family n=1 Tax=Alkalicoccobacillus plakortidis TaxID=444060 RepID=A0ABT0XIQ3_9BACI|nr:phage/plasmid primase, P4 family [Alkalicoccobacillus plakortidis]MCM2675595.1 phage/plasmid primase, P4 family [Alkalicoccobacillus plakortidis]
MNYDFDRIPDELKEVPQWIVWKSETRNNKPTKVPYRIDGKLAQSNNANTWSAFDDAVNAFYQHEYDGIGFMFSEDDPYVGVDIDKCMRDGELSDIAREIVEMMGSYTEVSPSETGLHIIVEGKLPAEITGTGRKNPDLGLEVYQHGRYFTFTGKRLNSNDIEPNTDNLASLIKEHFPKKEMKKPVQAQREKKSINNLSSRELWERMFNSKSGPGIKSLFNGELLNGDHSSSDLALCNHLAFWTGKDESLMDSMFRESSLVREKWDKQHSSDGRTYGQMTIDMAVSTTPSTIEDFYDKPHYEIYFSGKEQMKEEHDEFAQHTPYFRLSELGNAERIVHYHSHKLKYCNELGWLIWDGKVWREDNKMEIESIAAQTLRKLFKESSDADKDRKKEIYDWAERCERRSVRLNSIADARPMVAVAKGELDNHNYLFNCDNGIVDLKTGTLLPHEKDYLFTKISKVAYDKNADCPNWMKFLESIFQDEMGNVQHDIIDFMQKSIGYTLTGDISEQVMFFLFGTGRNGKSTFINTVQEILGDYGRQTNSDTFIKKQNDNSINNDIARLDGARFVSAVESEEGQQLAESLVKQITGGEKMSARFLRQEFFEFTPEFKVFFTTNHKPIIKGSDEGIWRRLRLIPFTVTIPKDKVDKFLPQKLAKEMPGILKWAVEGCMKWQNEGLKEPDAIKQATQGYREDMDILGPFIDEKCVINPLAKVEAKVLYSSYKDWCFDNGEFELKNRAFYRALESREFLKGRGTDNKNFFFGIGLWKENPELRASKSNSKVIPEQKVIAREKF